MQQIVLEFSDDQAARILAAVGRVDARTDKDGQIRPATLDEVHDRVIGYLTGIVRDQEAMVAQVAAVAAVAPLGVALKVVEAVEEVASTVAPSPKSV